MDLYYLVVLKAGKVRVVPLSVPSGETVRPNIADGERLITVRSETYAEEAAQIAYWSQLALDMQAELSPPDNGKHTQELFNVEDFK
jgi:hypothetical protein